MQITEYDPIAAGLEAAKHRFKDIAYDLTTVAGNKAAREDRRYLVGLRTSLEAKRKELKAPVLERAALIDSEAKRITAELLKLENPLDALIQADERRREEEKAAKAAANAKRIEAIMARIQRIQSIPVDAADQPSSTIELEIVALTGLGMDDFEEYSDAATKAKDVALVQLGRLHAAAVQREQEQVRIEAERAELARQQEEARQQEAARAELQRQEQARIDAERAELKRQADAQAAREKAARMAEESRERAAAAERKAAEERLAAERDVLARQQADFQRRVKEAEEAAQRKAAAEKAAADKAAADLSAAMKAANELVAKEEEARRAKNAEEAQASQSLAQILFSAPTNELDAGPTLQEVCELIADRRDVDLYTAERWLVDLLPEIELLKESV